MGHKYEVHEVRARLTDTDKTVAIWFAKSIREIEDTIISKVSLEQMGNFSKVYDGFYQAFYWNVEENRMYTLAWYVTKIY